MTGSSSKAGADTGDLDRLARLKARRKALAIADDAEHAPAAAPPPAAATGGGGSKGMMAFLQSGGDTGKAQRAAVGRKIVQILTQTPPDRRGMVPDTPFSFAGLDRLFGQLRERAAGSANPGSGAAKAALTFLTAADSDAEPGAATVKSGPSPVNITRLKLIATRFVPLLTGQSGAGQPVSGPVTSPEEKRRQMLLKIHDLMATTPADGRGLLPGTRYSLTGIEKLMRMVRERAAQPDRPGAAMASRLLERLQAAPDEPGAILGASPEKLRGLADRLLTRH